MTTVGARAPGVYRLHNPRNGHLGPILPRAPHPRLHGADTLGRRRRPEGAVRAETLRPPHSPGTTALSWGAGARTRRGGGGATPPPPPALGGARAAPSGCVRR